MAEVKTTVADKPVWVELASSDPTASGKFYTKVLGWRVEVSPDPQYGGYAVARLGGRDVAGIAPKQSPDAPTAWTVYIGTLDVDALAEGVQAAGGKVVAAPFDIGEQGRMAMFQDPVGAFIAAWQDKELALNAYDPNAPNMFGWVELNARGFDEAVPFYNQVFGWTAKKSGAGEGALPYTEFQLEGRSIAGGMEMNPMVPPEVPNHWMVYFNVDDLDGSFQQATGAGGREIVAPQDFPGGRFAILGDPYGAAFGILKMTERRAP